MKLAAIQWRQLTRVVDGSQVLYDEDGKWYVLNYDARPENKSFTREVGMITLPPETPPEWRLLRSGADMAFRTFDRAEIAERIRMLFTVNPKNMSVLERRAWALEGNDDEDT